MPKFVFDLLWTFTFGGALKPQGDLIKNTKNTNFLEFNFRTSLFNAKNLKSKMFRDYFERP